MQVFLFNFFGNKPMQHWKHFFAPTLIAVMSLGLLASTTVAKEVVAEPTCDVVDTYCRNFAKANKVLPGAG
tara:strand:- start:117 stop:329 length:213 start_codon:yes stop_codon:yes gene_type:complete